MSERTSRHLRRPSQSIFFSFDDLSPPISGSDDAVEKASATQNQAYRSAPSSAPPAPPQQAGLAARNLNSENGEKVEISTNSEDREN